MEIGLWQLLQLASAMPIAAQVMSCVSALVGFYAAVDRVRANRQSTPPQPALAAATATAVAATADVTPESLALMHRWTASEEMAQRHRAPETKDWIHIAIRIAGFVGVATLVISAVLVARYDFNEEYERLHQDLYKSRAKAQSSFASNCLVEHTAQICDTWRVAKDWTDATIASQAFHGACAHIGTHVIGAWEWATSSWAIWLMAVVGAAYWLYTGPGQAIRDANTLHARAVWAATMRSTQEKAIKSGTIQSSRFSAAAVTAAEEPGSTNYAADMSALPVSRTVMWTPSDRA